MAIANEPRGQTTLPTTATIHTTMGDMSFKLFPEQAPKTVENFAGLVKRGYYDGVIFHRVIKKFVSTRDYPSGVANVKLHLQMIQTGDPLGDGTGGESIWGREFEDEFAPTLRHDR